MTREELLERLGAFEWKEVEFKRAQKGAPEDAYRTVSAFANTAGGWLVFGIKESPEGPQISGVDEVDKVQNEFLSGLRAGGKLNRFIDVKADLLTVDGKPILLFYVPESPRTEKPVYLKGDPRQSYLRRGGGDERCTPRELERLLRDADPRPYDSGAVEEVSAEDFYDERLLRWYRRRYDEREPGRHETLNDLEFLQEWAFLQETPSGRRPTRGAVLLFGKARYVRQLLPRPVVDFQIIAERCDEWSPERRWADRIVVEDSILQAWLTLVERYMKWAERPFELDSTTLRRHDEPPDYVSFREAAINLLIHQDYGDLSRPGEIQLYRDCSRFRNPGDAFASTEQLLEPGAKEVRNPSLVAAFRRIGLSDQAGTGVRAIFRNWRQLGHVPPEINNRKDEKVFELLLRKEPLVSEKQKHFQNDLGVRLGSKQADLFAFGCLHGHLTLADAKAVLGVGSAEAQRELEALVVQRLLEPGARAREYALAEHLRARYAAAQSRGDSGRVEGQPESRPESQPESQPESLAEKVLALLASGPLGKSELSAALGQKTVSGQLNAVIRDLLAKGVLQQTIEDKPTSRLQKYRLAKP